jgi:hypothetical protein
MNCHYDDGLPSLQEIVAILAIASWALRPQSVCSGVSLPALDVQHANQEADSEREQVCVAWLHDRGPTGSNSNRY